MRQQRLGRGMPSPILDFRRDGGLEYRMCRRFVGSAVPIATDTIVALATSSGVASAGDPEGKWGQALQVAKEILGEARCRGLCTMGTTGRREDGADDVFSTGWWGRTRTRARDPLEISCHGNPFIVQAMLEDLFGRGCRPAEPGEFTQRAFLNGRMDLSQAEAVMDVIHARSEGRWRRLSPIARRAWGRSLRELDGGAPRRAGPGRGLHRFPGRGPAPRRTGWSRGSSRAILTGTRRLPSEAAITGTCCATGSER